MQKNCFVKSLILGVMIPAYYVLLYIIGLIIGKTAIKILKNYTRTFTFIKNIFNLSHSNAFHMTYK